MTVKTKLIILFTAVFLIFLSAVLLFFYWIFFGAEKYDREFVLPEISKMIEARNSWQRVKDERLGIALQFPQGWYYSYDTVWSGFGNEGDPYFTAGTLTQSFHEAEIEIRVYKFPSSVASQSAEVKQLTNCDDKTLAFEVEEKTYYSCTKQYYFTEVNGAIYAALLHNHYAISDHDYQTGDKAYELLRTVFSTLEVK